jgi:preprotein translocase subunit SecG
MVVLVTVIHVVVCLFLIAVVLLQSGKSADIAAAFGGQGSQTAFGPRSAANALTKATTWAAIIFMVTSFTLAIMATRRAGLSGSVLTSTPATTQAPAQKPAPATPPAQK